jgi:hypothetical protein
MKFCFITASNNEEILRTNLLASPDLAGNEISVQRGARSASEAYNRGIDASGGEIMIFLHNDMFLPAGWLEKLRRTVEILKSADPNWGVLGIIGVTATGLAHGHVYSTGQKRELGSDFVGVREIQSLDEIVLVLRRASGLRFDERLPGFHFYGTDICLEARSRGLKSYVFAAFGLHNTRDVFMLPVAYWQCYLYMRRKWRHSLPIMTLSIAITRWHIPVLRHLLYMLRRAVRRQLTGEKIGERVADPGVALAGIARKASA